MSPTLGPFICNDNFNTIRRVLAWSWGNMEIGQFARISGNFFSESLFYFFFQRTINSSFWEMVRRPPQKSGWDTISGLSFMRWMHDYRFIGATKDATSQLTNTKLNCDALFHPENVPWNIYADNYISRYSLFIYTIDNTVGISLRSHRSFLNQNLMNLDDCKSDKSHRNSCTRYIIFCRFRYNRGWIVQLSSISGKSMSINRFDRLIGAD